MSPRVRAALVASALTYGCGALFARALAADRPPALAPDFMQRLVVVTSWHGFGTAAFARLALTILAATAFLGIAGRFASLERRAKGGAYDGGRLDRGDVWFVAGLAVLALAGCAAWPFVFSSDVYAYAAYGEMTLRGLDPYRLVPAHAPGTFMHVARWQWSGPYPVCVYGPVFVAFARAVVVAMQVSGVAATLDAFRVLGAIAFLGSIVAFAAILRRVPTPWRFAALVAYGLDPAALWSVAEGHNDAFLAFLSFGGIALALHVFPAVAPATADGRGEDADAARIAAFLRRIAPTFGAGLVGIAAALKGTGLVFAAVFGFGLAGPWRGPRSRLLGAVLASSVVLAAVVSLPRMWPAFRAIGHAGRYAPGASLQSLIGAVPAAALAIAAAAYGAFRTARGDWRALAWLGIAAWLALPNPYPWYALWLAPLAALSGGGWAALALWGATISSVVRYLPDADGALSAGEGRLAALIATLPLVLLLGAPARRIVSQKATPSP